MCIVIDVNTFEKVFDTRNAHHKAFSPVYDWIIHDIGKLVFGGTTYEKETTDRSRRRLRIINTLRAMEKAVKIDFAKVDREEQRLLSKPRPPKFNDPHLVALLVVSKCQLICSEDAEAYPHLQGRTNYPKGHKLPRIYSKNTDACRKLLCRANCAECCGVCKKLNKVNRSFIADNLGGCYAA